MCLLRRPFQFIKVNFNYANAACISVLGFLFLLFIFLKNGLVQGLISGIFNFLKDSI